MRVLIHIYCPSKTYDTAMRQNRDVQQFTILALDLSHPLKKFYKYHSTSSSCVLFNGEMRSFTNKMQPNTKWLFTGNPLKLNYHFKKHDVITLRWQLTHYIYCISPFLQKEFKDSLTVTETNLMKSQFTLQNFCVCKLQSTPPLIPADNSM